MRSIPSARFNCSFTGTRRFVLVAILLATACSILVARPYAQAGQAQPAISQSARALFAQGVYPIALALETRVMSNKRQWALAFQFGKPNPEYRARTTEDAVKDVESLAASEKASATQALVKKYAAELKGTFAALGNSGRFVYTSGEVPVVFGSVGDQRDQLAVVITGLASDTIYNTIQLDVDKRAVSALRSVILPSLKAFDAFRNNGDVKYYGMSAVYGSQNFLDRSSEINKALTARAESLTFIVSSEQCRKFVRAELTEDELVSAADIYISDSDTTGMKKIRLILH